jgi:hypothetical protein
VGYLDDSSVQEEMVRSANALLRLGHDPLVSWFPYLGLGSPQFLHYQSLPAMLTGLVGIATGPDVAFRWSLYLLWCLWPVAIFLAAKTFGMSRWACAAAAAVSPLLASVPGVGYEQKAYIWIGWGVWAQLWASWALPFAWAFTWRAISDRRFTLPAVVAIMLTAALHYETGYLAFLPLAILPFLVPSDLLRRLGRAAVVAAGAVIAAAWVLVPLVILGKWASVNEALQGGPLVNGYGARQEMSWVLTGRLLDNGHFPVVSLLAAAGVVVAVARWRSQPIGRALLALACLGLVLSFGRTTFGSLVRILPGSTDIFFRRFALGAQLGAIFLAGLGAATLAALARRALGMLAERLHNERLARARWLPVAVVSLAGAAYLIPSWNALVAYDSSNSSSVQRQRAAESVADPHILPLVDYTLAHGGGRVYAGLPSNWGSSFTVGEVPVYEFLASQDVDEVGFTLRTASLMTGPEFDFDENQPGDYTLFGIRYLILPRFRSAPVAAQLVMSNGSYSLYEIPSDGYLSVVETVGTITADRADVAAVTAQYLRGNAATEGRYLTVGWAGATPPSPSAPAGGAGSGSPGSVVSSSVDLAAGQAEATVQAARPAVVVLSASYDPGWTASVDGRPSSTEMIAPAIVGVEVPAGRHQVTFRYVGYRWYGELWALALLDLLLLGLLTTPAWSRLSASYLRRRPETGRRRRGGALSGARPQPRRRALARTRQH